MNYRYQEFEFPTDLSPFGLFQRVEASCDHAFLLESLGEDSAFSRFTYIGAAPEKVIQGYERAIEVNGERKETASPYHELRSHLPQVSDLPTHYHGGLVGYVAYDGTSYFEPAFAGRVHSAFPKFEFGLYLDGFLYDKFTETFRYFTLDKDRRAYFQSLLAAPYVPSPCRLSNPSADMDGEEYKKGFETIKKRISAGDTFQTVFSIGFTYEKEGNPLRIYECLRQVNPSPHMYFIKFGQRVALGASPELLFRTGGRTIEHFGTLAGTVKRGKDAKEDKALAQQMQDDDKEVAEHMMLVDLARNDVGKVAEIGSVKVESLMAVKRFSHVQHLSSEVYGVVKEGCDSFDVLASCAPAGTLTGAPKIEAMKIIDDIEKSPRGIYGGSVGYFSVNGDAMFAIAIRSLFVSGDKAYTRSGSGIVYDSVCEKEYEEVMNKHKAMEKTLELAATKTRVPDTSVSGRSASPTRSR
jgi:anthranilate synthase component 1